MKDRFIFSYVGPALFMSPLLKVTCANLKGFLGNLLVLVCKMEIKIIFKILREHLCRCFSASSEVTF
jgi:hypothetical protein